MHIIGDGNATHLWWDCWNPHVPLVKKHGLKVIQNLRLPADTMVNEVIKGSDWG